MDSSISFPVGSLVKMAWEGLPRDPELLRWKCKDLTISPKHVSFPLSLVSLFSFSFPPISILSSFSTPSFLFSFCLFHLWDFYFISFRMMTLMPSCFFLKVACVQRIQTIQTRAVKKVENYSKSNPTAEN